MWILKSLTLKIAILAQYVINGVTSMSCYSSLQSIQYVQRCPRNSLEWVVREDLFNCSSINHTCGTVDMFRYHCVLNEDGTKLLEVCAPYKYIYGQRCAEFDPGGTIIQENSNNCSNALVPCPGFYISTDAHKYQSCYDVVQIIAGNETTYESTNCRSESLENKLFIASTILIHLIILAIYNVLYFRWKRERKSYENQSQSTIPLVEDQKFEKSKEKHRSIKPSTSTC